MEPANKKKKLKESEESDFLRPNTKRPKTQSTITSFFKKVASTVPIDVDHGLSLPSASPSVEEQVKEAMEIDTNSFFDFSDLTSSSTPHNPLTPSQTSLATRSTHQTAPATVPKPSIAPFSNNSSSLPSSPPFSSLQGPKTPSATRQSNSIPKPSATSTLNAAKPINRFIELDAEDQRQLDKKMKQQEKNAAKYGFLENPLDAMRRGREDVDYDPSTLHIPATIYYNMTEFERQYWDIKSKYFNYVVFFQKGLFYELMEGDALLALSELGTAPMDRSGMRSTGFSTESGEAMALKLVSRGHSVVFVTQTESPIDRRTPTIGLTSPSKTNQSTSSSSSLNTTSSTTWNANNSSTSSMDISIGMSDEAHGTMSNPLSPLSPPRKGKRSASEVDTGEKMLRRVVDRIMTPGTTPDIGEDSHRPVFLLSLVTLPLLPSSSSHATPSTSSHIESNPVSASHSSSSHPSSSTFSFGVCLFNASSGSFIVGEILEPDDESSLALLHTLLLYTRPREVLFPKNNPNKHVLQMLKLQCHEKVVLRARDDLTSSPLLDPLLQGIIGQCCQTPVITSIRSNEAMKRAVVTMGGFLKETNHLSWVFRASWDSLDSHLGKRIGDHLVMDGKTLENLNVVEDEERQVKNSLLGILDKTETVMGRRMLFQWICHPLQSPYLIEERLQIVDFLISAPSFTTNLQQLLLKLGKFPESLKNDTKKSNLGYGSKLDLEKMIAKGTSNLMSPKIFFPLLTSLMAISSHFMEHWMNAMDIWPEMPESLVTLVSSFHGNIDKSSSGTNQIASEWEIRSTLYPEVAIEERAHEEIEVLKSLLDYQAYHEDQSILPASGISQLYDNALSKLESLEEKFQACLSDIRRFYTDKGVPAAQVLAGTSLHEGKDASRCVEIATSLVKGHGSPIFLKPSPSSSKAKSAAYQRFTTNQIEHVLMPEWKEAKLMKERGTTEAFQLVALRLTSCSGIWWKPWIQTLSQLDCLLSLSIASQIDPERQQRPKLFCLPSDTLQRITKQGNIDAQAALQEVERPFIAITGSVHPILALQMASTIFASSTHQYDAFGASQARSHFGSSKQQVISNDVLLGELPRSLEEEFDCFGFEETIENNALMVEDKRNRRVRRGRSMLLTGPNMGGKSTLLRQVSLAVIMTQVGCYPFGRLAMSSCDAIFTRLGARDSIYEGKSTFMVEMQEASSMISLATSRSLVLCDELGRGTSTFDGYSLAYAALQHLTLRNEALTLFSTHYHLLTQEMREEEAMKGKVEMWHMDAMVNERQQTVTFLYKLTRGSCPHSYGLMVAAMAGIPSQVVQAALIRSTTFHATLLAKRISLPSLRQNFLHLTSLIRTLSKKRFDHLTSEPE